MDTLTHALSGALLARAMASPLQTKTLPLRLQITAGLTAAIFPDIDFVLRLISTITYLNWHQGPTHSLIMLPLWAWLLAILFSKFNSCRYHWRLFYVPACLGLGIHIAGDWVTAYGVMLFAPFSMQRFSLPLAFVIDPSVTIILIIGLFLSWRFPQHRIFAVATLLSLVVYFTLLLSLHERALKVGQHHANTQTSANATVSVLPQPLSPFNWKIIIQDKSTYALANINLWPYQQISLQSFKIKWLQEMSIAYQSVTTINWQYIEKYGDNLIESKLAHEAWIQPNFSQFRQFSVFPQLDYIDYDESGICVWFFDLRFKFPSLPASFRYGMCHDDKLSTWNMQRQPGVLWID